MKYLIIFSFIILSFNKGFAQKNIKDSLVLSYPKDSLSQYSKEWFLKNYGDDDNSKAIIDFYIFKYKDYKSTPLIASILGVPSAIAFALIINNPNGNILLLGLGIPILGSIVISSIISTVYSIIYLHKYDNVHLLNTLKDYNRTRKLPKKLERSRDFKKTLRLIQEN